MSNTSFSARSSLSQQPVLVRQDVGVAGHDGDGAVLAALGVVHEPDPDPGRARMGDCGLCPGQLCFRADKDRDRLGREILGGAAFRRPLHDPEPLAAQDAGRRRARRADRRDRRRLPWPRPRRAGGRELPPRHHGEPGQGRRAPEGQGRRHPLRQPDALARRLDRRRGPLSRGRGRRGGEAPRRHLHTAPSAAPTSSTAPARRPMPGSTSSSPAPSTSRRTRRSFISSAASPSCTPA